MAKTILIIDHKPGPIRRARRMLERAGYRVEVARDGAAGLSAFERLSPGLTVVGEALPDRKGPTVCRELKDQSPGSPTPILMVGSRRDPDRDQLGCDEYLNNPVDEQALLDAVRRHVGEGSADRPAKTVSGDLEHLNIAEIVQTLSLGMKTACITLSSDELSGRIWFEKGRVRHAATGDLDAETAFFEMMTWASGEFSIENGAIYPKLTIERDTMFLVMEGLRRIDEATEAKRAADSAPEAELDLAALEAPDEEVVETAEPVTATAVDDGDDGDDGETTPASDEGAQRDSVVPSSPVEVEEITTSAGEHDTPCIDRPEPVPSLPLPPATPLSAPPAPKRSWALVAAALGIALFGVGIVATVRALRPSVSATVPVPIRIGPMNDAATDAAEDLAVTEVDEIWDGYVPVEYPESPLGVPAVEEMHTAWELLEKDTGDPLMAAAVDAEPGREPGGPTTDPHALSAADAEPGETLTSAVGEAETGSEPAEPVAAGPTSEVAAGESVKDPGAIDLSASLAAADAILADMPAPEPPPPVAEPVEPSIIDLYVASSVREGTLTLLVDDAEVLSRALAAPRRTRQTFDASISVDAGQHRVVARLDLNRQGYSYEQSIVVNVETGGTVALDLIAGKNARRPIMLTVR